MLDAVIFADIVKSLGRDLPVWVQPQQLPARLSFSDAELSGVCVVGLGRPRPKMWRDAP